MMTPRSFSSVIPIDDSIVQLLNLSRVLHDDMHVIAFRGVEGRRRYLLDQRARALMSGWNSAEAPVTWQYSLASSANSLIQPDTCIGMPSTNMVNRVGPSTDPWRIYLPLITAHWHTGTQSYYDDNHWMTIYQESSNPVQQFSPGTVTTSHATL